ncbi:MAG: histidine kinase [Cyclobacteriaceae bacterium]
MQKVAAHLAFWSLYFVWQVYVEYEADAKSIPGFTTYQAWTGALLIETIILPIKVAASYSCFYLLKRWQIYGSRSKSNYPTFLGIVSIILVAILLHRLVSNYIAYPLELGRPVRITFWEPIFIINSAVDCIFIVVIFVSLNFVHYQSKLVSREIQLRKEKLEAELHFLRTQINPHFLFNTLNNIYSLSIKRSDLTPQAILKLSKLMRFIVHEAREDQISLRQEIDLIEDYIALEKLRFTDHRLTLKYERNIDNENLLIAPLILLSFVENAFKHGAGANDQHTLIDLSLSNEGSTLQFNISNTMRGSHKTIDKKIGLRNAEQQLKMIYKSYVLKILPEENKFTIKLSLDLDSYDTNQMHHSRG